MKYIFPRKQGVRHRAEKGTYYIRAYKRGEKLVGRGKILLREKHKEKGFLLGNSAMNKGR